MPATSAIFETVLEGVRTCRRGKVRDMFEVGDDLLIVASDRISAYDFVLGSVIPNKGKVLTQLSAFWFDRTRHIVPNHMRSVDPKNYPDVLRPHADLLAGRSMLVRLTRPLPIECVARGYLAGSGWKEYKETGHVCGVTLPPGLRESERLPQPIFTPATKAENGHDVNITEAEAAATVGRPLIEQLRELTLNLYSYGAAHAEARGILVADTKFEFGLALNSANDEVLLIDEILTPDSSRFWPLDRYTPGAPQLSFDKQYVRDYLDSIKWNRQPPVPDLPADVVAKTSEKYLEAFRSLTGQTLT